MLSAGPSFLANDHPTQLTRGFTLEGTSSWQLRFKALHPRDICILMAEAHFHSQVAKRNGAGVAERGEPTRPKSGTLYFFTPG